VTTTPPPTNHLGKAQQALAVLGFLIAGGLGLIRLGMWISEVKAPPAAVALPAELAEEVGACRQLVRVLRAGPVPRREQ
jgi:hypothetical protein